MGKTSDTMMFVPIMEIGMAEAEAVARVKNILKAELKRRGLSYRDLAERLTANGIPETERNLANKIARGTFTAAFFVQCLTAIGASSVRLDDN
jgi:ribosome-binding protein aMBF1 (putative translation factor)